jgi:hypothetical protein
MGAEACDEVRELIPELALGIADGEERARVLDHVLACEQCAQELEELSAVADELVVLAPEHDPPAGFERRVLRRLRPPARTRRWRLPALVTASASVAALATAAIVLVAVHGDLRLADQYRQTLSEAHGSSFRAVPLLTGSGNRAGSLFVYRGRPSWIFVTTESDVSRVARAELVLKDGATVALPAFSLAYRDWGVALPVDPSRVAAVRLLDDRGLSLLVAYFPQSW